MNINKKYLNVIGIVFCFFVFISFPRTIDKTASHPITDYGQEEQLNNGIVIWKNCRGVCKIIISNNGGQEIYFSDHGQYDINADSFILDKNYCVDLNSFLEGGDSVAFAKDVIKVIRGIDEYYFKIYPSAKN